MNSALLDQVMSLPPSDRLDLLERIWDSLSPAIEAEEISDDEKQALDNRWSKYVANPESALTLEELKAEVAKRMR